MADKNYISDELLAAFLEGNTSEAETRQVLQALQEDVALQEALDLALQVTEEEQHPLSAPLPMLQMAALHNGENLCSVLCEAYVLHQRGIEVPIETLIATAREQHWLKPEGTPLHAIGQLLASEGLMVTRLYDATLQDMAEALHRHNEVIAVVDSEKLHPEQPDPDDAPNHAVVVTALDLEQDCISLYDPQVTASPQATLSAKDVFLPAWRESRCYMVRVLRSSHDYQPRPIGLESIEITDELMELREVIAENAHEVWAAARMREGWTYGFVRNDVLKQHPDLLPYSALPDSEKEYDRLMALHTIRLVKRLGFDITKRNS